MLKHVSTKIFFLLWGAALFSVVAIMPYMLSLQGEVLAQAPLPLPLLLILSFVQSSVLMAVFIYLGLLFSKKVGKTLPIISALAEKKFPKAAIKQITPISIGLGILAGVLIVGSELVFQTFGWAVSAQAIHIPVWQGLLASFYGGIAEEIITRLFLMTFIVFLLSIGMRKNGKAAKPWMYVLSIGISALVFGALHLPTVAALVPLTAGIIIRTLVLNSIGAVIFGTLYWKKGLFAAMVAHFTTDIVLHVIVPLIGLV